MKPGCQFGSIALLLLTGMTLAVRAQTPAAPGPSPDLNFSFGPTAPTGATAVTPENNYTIERGYGFDLGSAVAAEPAAGGAAVSVHGVNGRPFFFSAKLAPGAYLVTVTLGSAQHAATTTVKSETRRLMLESVPTAAGQFETRSFLVHIRVPQIPGGGVVRLKPREKDIYQVFLYWEEGRPQTLLELDWDEKLTLEFSGEQAAVAAVAIRPAVKPVTVYLVGDSTMTDQNMEPWGAWGMQLPRWFRPPVLIANYAQSGESAASFFSEQRWPKLMSEIHAGDYVLVQFGINDRTLPAAQVRNYFSRFVNETRAKGATPVLVTSQNLRAQFFDANGKGQQTLGGYPDAMKAVAQELNAPLIDLNAMSTVLYEAIGAEQLPKAFVDTTHQNDYGSYELAKCVVQGLIDAKLPFVAGNVVSEWKPFDPAHPDTMEDFHLPHDPQWDPKLRPGTMALPTTPIPIAGRPGEMASPPPPTPAAPARGAGARSRGPAAAGATANGPAPAQTVVPASP